MCSKVLPSGTLLAAIPVGTMHSMVKRDSFASSLVYFARKNFPVTSLPCRMILIELVSFPFRLYKGANVGSTGGFLRIRLFVYCWIGQIVSSGDSPFRTLIYDMKKDSAVFSLIIDFGISSYFNFSTILLMSTTNWSFSFLIIILTLPYS